MTTDQSPTIDAKQARSVKIAVVAVLALAVLIAAFALLKSEPRIAATNSVTTGGWGIEEFAVEQGQLCASNQYVPAGVGAVRVFAGTYGKADVQFDVTLKTATGEEFSSGSVRSPADPQYLNIPVQEVKTTVPEATTCIAIASDGEVALGGSDGSDAESALKLDGKELGTDIHLDYMTAESKSIASMIPAVFARASLFRPGWQGSWWFYLLLLIVPLTIAAAAVALVRAIKDPARQNTRRWAIAIVVFAGINAFVWSTVAPIFMTPDENGHYAYVETIGQSHVLPSRDAKKGGYGSYGNHHNLAVNYTASNTVLNKDARLPWNRATYEQWQAEDRALPDLGKKQGGGWTSASSYSPVYYAPAVVPWLIAGDADVFTKAWLIRLWSVLLTMVAALFCFLFARELLPTVAWAAPVAGLAAAFQPMFVHMGGAINNDSMLIAVSSALLYLLARAFRRGMDTRLAAAIAAVFAFALVVKPTSIAFAPAVVFTVVFALNRERRAEGRSMKDVWRTVAAGTAAFFAVIIALYLPFASGDSATQSTNLASTSNGYSAYDFVLYMWSWYLPDIPGLKVIATTEGLPVINVFLKGFLADFNTLDTHFSDNFYYAVTLVLLTLAAGLLAWGIQNKDRFRDWWAPAAMCVVATVGLLWVVNIRSYMHFAGTGEAFAQGRYLLPLVAIFAAGLVAGAQGFKRWAPTVAAVVVCSLFAINAFGMMLSMSRFYV